MVSYEQYCNYFANKCKTCKGEKRVNVDGFWRCCACQYIAFTKWEYDRIKVTPPSLKCLTWDDFTGAIKGKNFGILEENSFVQAKEKSMRYCFGDACYDGPKNRSDNLIIQNKITSGQNVVISGSSNTGKSLIALLMIKEVIYTSVIHKCNIKFKWVQSTELANAGRWDNTSSVNHDFLDEISEVEFLVLDGLDMSFAKGHTTPPDAIAMDMIFDARRMSGHPTIFICSSSFKFTDKYVSQTISKFWGNGILRSMGYYDNVFIDLHKKEAELDVKG